MDAQQIKSSVLSGYRLRPIDYIQFPDVFHLDNDSVNVIFPMEIVEETHTTIFVTKKKCDGKSYAVKYIELKKLKEDELGRVVREIQINSIISHKNIVHMHDVYELTREDCEVPDYYLVMEWMSGGDLWKRVIETQSYMSEDEIKRTLIDVLEAINYLHQIRIAHRDIKPDNIVFAGATAKLIDFGYAKIEEQPVPLSHTPIGTHGYFAPEIIGEDAYMLGATDMWSVGCVAYFMLCRVPPFHAKTEEEMDQLILGGDYDFPDDIEFTDDAIDFIQNLLAYDAKSRLTAEKALEHPWLKSKSHHQSHRDFTILQTIDENTNQKLRNSMERAREMGGSPNPPERVKKESLRTSSGEIIDVEMLDAARNPFWSNKRKKGRTKGTSSGEIVDVEMLDAARNPYWCRKDRNDET